MALQSRWTCAGQLPDLFLYHGIHAMLVMPWQVVFTDEGTGGQSTSRPPRTLSPL